MAKMINKRFKRDNTTLQLEDNFEILKLNVSDKMPYNNVDWTFICDKSGSMYQGKLACLQYTLNKMLDYLYENSKEKNNNHYVHIITFNTKAAGFDFIVNKEANIDEMKKKINNINASGMTNVGIAFDKFDRTTYENEVSYHNVIFMSDGEITSGIHNSDILKNKFQDKLDKLSNNTPISIGYGNGHDISFMEKIASVTNGDYHCIENTEGAGVVYGEVLHSCLNEYCRNATLVIENGQVYDYKSNTWVQSMDIGRLISDKQHVWHVKRDNIEKPVDARINGIDVNKHNVIIATSEVIEPDGDNIDKEVEKYILRQKTQELLAEARNMHEGQEEDYCWMNGIPPPPAIPRLYTRNNNPSINICLPENEPVHSESLVGAQPSVQLGGTPISPLSGNIDSPPQIKRQRASSNSSNNLGTNKKAKVLTLKTPRELLIQKMNKHLEDLKTYINDNGDEDGFVAMLCDDTYIAICGVKASNGKHYIVARQVSQGSQRAYMASDLGELEVNDDNSHCLTSHVLNRSKTTPYASVQVSQVIRSVTDGN